MILCFNDKKSAAHNAVHILSFCCSTYSGRIRCISPALQTQVE